MPLTELVRFKAVLQSGNRFQVPRLIRWQFKLEPTQVLRVTVTPVGAHMVSEEFFARMSRDGRITIPKLIVNLLIDDVKEESLVGYAFEIDLKPTQSSRLNGVSLLL